jgi:co-chaperonin GroES (HSP10)
MNISKAKTIKPINRNIIVKMDNRETETTSGIHLPEVSQATNVWGVCVAVSDECEDIKEGDRVFVSLHVGTHMRVDRHDDVVILDERKVMLRE